MTAQPQVAAGTLRGEVLAIAAGIAIVSAAWAKLAAADVTLLAQHDAVEQTWPWWLHNVTEIQNGRLPLWNPFANGGQSHIGEGQSFALYPPMLLVAWAGGAWAQTTAALHTMGFLHAVLAFLGGYALGRSAKAGPAGALVCGLVTSLGGFFSTRAVHQFNIFMANAWTPLALVGPLRAADTGRLKWLLLTGLALAMSLLAGHAQPAYQAGIAAGVLFLVASYVRLFATPPLGMMRLVVGGLILAISTAAVGAAQLWPMTEYQARSVRWVGGDQPVPADAPLDYKTMAANASLRPEDAASFFFQGVEKTPDDGSLYLGACAAVLAFVGVAVSTNRTRWVFAGMAIFGILVALGELTPFLRLAYYLPLNRTRAPIRWLLVSHLSLAVLAGLGAEAIAGASRRFAALIAAGLAAIVIGVGGWLAATMLNPAAGATGLTIGLAAGGVAIVVALFRAGRVPAQWPVLIVTVLVAIELSIGMSRVFIERPEAATDTVATFLKSQTGHFRIANWDAPILENLGVVERIPSLSGFGATRPVRIHRFQEHVYPHGWDLAGVRFFLSGPSAPSLGRDDLESIAEIDGVKILENRKAYPLAWLVGGVQVAEDTEKALEAVAAPDFDGRATAIVLKRDLSLVSHVEGPASGQVEIRAYEPGHIRLGVKTALPALLVTSEAEYPGWETRVDGAVTPSINVNYAFRAVAVERGEHEVAMTYRPRSVYGGIWISVVSFFAVGAALAFVRR